MAWSAPVTIAPATAEPVLPAQLREFQRIDDEGEDLLLETLLSAARAHVESMTGTRLVEQVVELRADDWSDLLRLPIGPVAAIEDLAWFDRDGQVMPVDASAYEVVGAGLTAGIRPSPGNGWPNGPRAGGGSIRVTVIVGYEQVPPELVLAILLMAGDVYANRETVVVGTVSNEVKSSIRVDALLANHRIWL